MVNEMATGRWMIRVPQLAWLVLARHQEAGEENQSSDVNALRVMEAGFQWNFTGTRWLTMLGNPMVGKLLENPWETLLVKLLDAMGAPLNMLISLYR